MLSKIAGFATGYLLAWTISTPQGRKAALQIGKAALRQMGQTEKQLIKSFIKGGKDKDEQTNEREADGRDLLREGENPGDDR